MAHNNFVSGRFHLALAVCIFASSLLICEATNAQTVYQIWSPRSSSLTKQTTQECFFRKKFTLIQPEMAQVYVSANDEFEMYLNGKLVEKGESRGQQRVLDVSEYMEPGVNLIAVRVRQVSENAPMLALKFRTKEKNETRWRSLTTDNTWKSRQREVKNWYHNSLNDIGWLSANQMAEINFNRPAQRTAVTATQSSQPQAPQTAIAQPPTSTGSTTKTVETPQTPQMASRLLETTNSNLDLPRPLMVDSTIGLSSNGSCLLYTSPSPRD